MGNGTNRFSAGAAEMERAARQMQQLLPDFRTLSQHTRSLTGAVQAVRNLPDSQRMEKYRELIRSYAEHIRNLGTTHDTVMPALEAEIAAALDAIDEASRSTSRILSSSEFEQLRDSLDCLSRAIRGARGNLSSFRGTLNNMPEIDAQATTIRDSVQKSLDSASATFDRLIDRIQDLQLRVLRIGPTEE